MRRSARYVPQDHDVAAVALIRDPGGEVDDPADVIEVIVSGHRDGGAVGRTGYERSRSYRMGWYFMSVSPHSPGIAQPCSTVSVWAVSSVPR